MGNQIDLTSDSEGIDSNDPSHTELRQRLIKVCMEASRCGLPNESVGSASARSGEYQLITPVNLKAAEMIPSDVAVFSPNGGWVGNHILPAELDLHHRIMAARPDINAILHLRPPASTALACLRMDIPPFHEAILDGGGDSIRCAPYAPTGSDTLAEVAVQALDGRMTCLLANNGLLACGDSPEAALELGLRVESLCAIYLRVRSMGEPTLLSEAELDTVRLARRLTVDLA